MAPLSPLVRVSRKLTKTLAPMEFEEPVASTYNPLVYARVPAEAYLTRFGGGKKKVVMLGMNPGPWGMAQTGVPFGEIAAVRDWMKIEGKVGKPAQEHEKRPVLGFECTRSEVSGRRLWGLFSERFESAEAFFEDFFVLNYCPLIFLEAGGKNRVPEKLKKHERVELLEKCDEALAATLDILAPELVIGVGAWAKKRVKAVVGDNLRVGQILHPSPANPHANKGWAEKAAAQLSDLGITLPSS